MMTSEGPAATMTSKVRRLHAHDFPAVDLALTPFPETEAQRMRAQRLLDDVIQPTLCWNDLNRRLELTLENATAGHSWPSGATPDRRAWVELTAYAGDAVIYSSGGAAAFPLEASADPDLWLMRDCLFDGAGQEVHMFWEAATTTGNAVPGSVILNVNDPSSFNRTHPRKAYPAAGMLPMMPDRVSVKVHLQAIGDDVLADLVASGDLDPAIPPRIARFQLGGAAALEWTPATAAPRVDPMTSATLLCVVKPITYRANTVPAVSHARCQAP
jgi:hypothetical protein